MQSTLSKHFNMFVGEMENVILQFDNSLINVVVDRFSKEISIQKVDDQHFKFHVSVATGPTFLSWLFMFGDKVKILSPERLQDEFVARIQSVLGLYK